MRLGPREWIWILTPSAALAHAVPMDFLCIAYTVIHGLCSQTLKVEALKRQSQRDQSLLVLLPFPWRLSVLESVSDSPLVINATTTASTVHRHGDNSSRPSTYTASSNTAVSSAFRSPPLPSTFFNAAMTPFSRLPVFFSPPPPLNYHRQGQETLRHQHPVFVNQDSAATAYRRDLGAMEGRQARLAISLILASRSAVFRMDHFMRVCDRHIHTSISLLSVSREVQCNSLSLNC